jgi:ribulose-phosphate 3-epimerase
MKKIAPSILSADFSRLGDEVREVEEAGADLIHVDVMDGHFVPNISVGLPVVRALKGVTRLPLDVHLMIEEPERYIEEFVKAGASILSFHLEASKHLHRTLERIRELGIMVGVALNPGTPLGMLEEVVGEVDLVVLMSVDPGFGGQAFIRSSLDKIRRLKDWLFRLGLERVLIEVDGGIKLDNIREVAQAGADILVSGSGIFGEKDRKRVIRMMREKLEDL